MDMGPDVLRGDGRQERTRGHMSGIRAWLTVVLPGRALKPTNDPSTPSFIRARHGDYCGYLALRNSQFDYVVILLCDGRSGDACYDSTLGRPSATYSARLGGRLCRLIPVCAFL